jgi:hypothetical protein
VTGASGSVGNANPKSDITIDNLAQILEFNLIGPIVCLGGIRSVAGNTGTTLLNSHLGEWREFGPQLIPLGYVGSVYEPQLSFDLMHQMQSFVDSTGCSAPKIDKTSGVFCTRQTAALRSVDGITLELVERRYSLMLSMVPMFPYGQYTLVSVVDEFILNSPKDAKFEFVEDLNQKQKVGFSKSYLIQAGPFMGVTVFQARLCGFIRAWEHDWAKTLDSLNRTVSVKVRFLFSDVIYGWVTYIEDLAE